MALPLLETAASGVQAADQRPETRTMMEIIWGCASTTFICTWKSVHPNVPPREECGWKYLLRRLRLMFWALVAPELVLVWSAKQWYVAGKIANTYNKEKGPGIGETLWSYVKNGVRGKVEEETQAWTRTHGHLVAMGGIVLIEPDSMVNDGEPEAEEEPTILTFEILEDLLKDPGFEIGFTGKEIEDKAKGDFLSKCIVISQTTWFIMQCGARFVQKIAITELEVVTLALASLNAFMFFFWWSKPLGLAVPMKVHVERRLARRIKNSGGWGLHKFISSFADRYTMRLFEDFWLDQGERFSIRWFFFFPRYALKLFFVLVLRPIIFGAASLYSVMVSNSIPFGATHVPTFYSPGTDADVDVFRTIFPISGAVFGGLHCLGWMLPYPTRAEGIIWKFGSLIVAIIPLLYYVTALFSKFTRGDGQPVSSKLHLVHTFLRVVGVVVAIISIAFSVVYMIARMTLLVLAIVLLRKQPTTVFLVVDWTKFVPHIKF